MPKTKQENDGSFTIDFIKNYKGKRIHIFKKGFSSQMEAERNIPVVLEKRLFEHQENRDKSSFKTFFDSYLEYRSNRLRESTLLSVKAVYNSFLKELGDLKTHEALSIHSTIRLHKTIIDKRDVCEKWKNRVIGEMRQIVEYASFKKLIPQETALDDKMILENVPICKKVKEKGCYSLNQLRRFLNSIDDENDKDAMTVFAYLGARISEFIGLTWDCYDSKNKTIEIKQQILYLQKGKPILTSRLKTKESYRKCKLNQATHQILEKRNKMCSVGFIFSKSPNEPNEPISKTTLRNKMRHYMNLAKLPFISPHGFRHTKASILMSVCKTMSDVKAAAKFLGHSVTMMMETYAHEEAKTIDILIKRMEEQ